MRVRSPYVFEKSKGEKTSSEIITVPNLALSVKEILERFTRGIEIDSADLKESIYQDQDMDFDDLDYESLKRADFDEIHELKTSLKEKQKNLQERLEDLKKPVKKTGKNVSRQTSSESSENSSGNDDDNGVADLEEQEN